MLAERLRLLKIICQTSFRSKPTAVFRLASGRMSRYYVDCKQALSYPEARDLIGQLILDIIKDMSLDAVGGLEIGAYPIATSISDKIYEKKGTTVRAFVVRKEPKSHGITSLLAGDAKPGDKVLIVDDVITTGRSTIDAVLKAREAGLKVEKVIVLVDRQEDDGKRNIEREGVACVALFTLADLLSVSKATATVGIKAGISASV